MASAASGEECIAPVGSLRWIARQQLKKAGEDTAAAREIADRLDGKVPQAIVGDEEHPPVNVTWMSPNSLQSLTCPDANSTATTTESNDSPKSSLIEGLAKQSDA